MQRDWWVYSTVIHDRAILVKDRNSGARGSIDDPTDEEWTRAWSAPSNPYPWDDPARVVIDPSTLPESVEEARTSANRNPANHQLATE